MGPILYNILINSLGIKDGKMLMKFPDAAKLAHTVKTDEDHHNIAMQKEQDNLVAFGPEVKRNETYN